MDIFIKNASKDEELAKNAVPGDLDMIISPKDGALVVVCQVDGVHVCGRCLEQFIDERTHPDRAVEWNPPDGLGTRMLLHSRCVKPAKPHLIQERVRGHQARRFATKATKYARK